MGYSEFDGNLGMTDLTILTGNANLPHDMPNDNSPQRNGVVDMAVLTGNANLPADMAFTNFNGPNEHDDLASYDEFSNLFGRGRGVGSSRRRKPRRRSGRSSRSRSKSSRPTRRSSGRSRRSKGRSGGGNFGGWLKDTFTTKEGRERRNIKRKDKQRQTEQAMKIQQDLVKQGASGQGETAALLKTIAGPQSAPAPEDKGMSTAVKIGLAVGGLVVVGVLVFAISRTMKKKKASGKK